jgi:energy-coupling factor transporter ATP-binding protein EcfA2
MDSYSRSLLIKELISALKQENVLLQAPTGWGKTTLMLQMLVLLAKEGWKVGFTAPTLFLLAEKWKELRQMMLSEPNPPRAILTAGAGQHCVYQWSIPQRFCPRCKLYSRSVNVHFGDFVSFEDIEKQAPEDVCGYWAQEAVLHRYDIILGHYGRLNKIIHLLNFLFVDEAHEKYLPKITSFSLAEVAQLLGVRAEELTSVAVVRELVEERLYAEGDPRIEDKLWSLHNAVKKTCWIEADELHCMDLYELPQRVRIFAATATPPPGWPPEGWGRKIVIEPKIKPQAFIETSNTFYYRDRYEGLGLQLYLIIRWLRQKFNAKRVIIFATASARRVISASIEASDNPLDPPPEGVVIADAWGKMRVGVNLPWYDAAILTGISLPPTARRRLRAEGRDPDKVESVQAVQLAGRILRPRHENETYEDVLKKRIIVFADARYAKHADYLHQFFDIRELPANL